MSLPWQETSSASEQFFELAQERYRMKLRRERGDSAPWTQDPVLQAYRFCNVRREDDKTTIWFRENLRDPLRDDPHRVLWATVAFRWFNRIETGELIKDVLLGDWSCEDLHERLDGVSPLVTGAYMIKSPPGLNKLTGILKCLARVADVEDQVRLARTMAVGHACLMQVPYLGGFMAYEVISDLRWTCLFEDAPDILTWCHLGPGAARGIEWVTGVKYNRNSPLDQMSMLKVCYELLQLSRIDRYWPQEWPAWEMREVEHWLCEYDKWRRGDAGQHLKRRYQNVRHQHP